MILNENNLKNINAERVSKPSAETFSLQERVIQFGTGVLLRGLPDYFIDKANQTGIFNGRILVVKSTSKGELEAFSKQDNLYTLCIKGIQDGVYLEEFSINSSISRTLSAAQDWTEILKAARQPEMQIVISNTTEAGIVKSNDSITSSPPNSYPGKLLSFLHERYTAFKGSAESGMVILPTELISNNGDLLKKILVDLAMENTLGSDFENWLMTANHFCNTLVDRIVPGKLPESEQRALEIALGYEDELMIMAEPFRLWAIESSSEKVQEILSFAKADKGVVIVPSIEKFKELKLRILNGSHTISCALAILAGFSTVKEAMANTEFAHFISKLMKDEIVPALKSQDITIYEAVAFVDNVIDRFRNPSLAHLWESISLNYTSKLRMRNIPLIKNYFDLRHEVPQHTALGVAAYIIVMNVKKVDDEFRESVCHYWKDPETVVFNILGDRRLWNENLNDYPGFNTAVKSYVEKIQNDGVIETIKLLSFS